MKQTDEAEQLREEIERLYMRVLHWHDTQQEIRLIEIQALPGVINKVLDAAEKSLTDCLLYECVDVGPGSVIIESINKLRPKP